MTLCLKGNLLWFAFSQNNSGGFFIQNDSVDHYVMVQAPSAAEAVEKANEIFSDYSEYCECCGERWSTYFIDDSDGSELPMIYGEPVTHAEKGMFREFAILHLWDGRVAKARLTEGDDLNVAEWVTGGGDSIPVFNETTKYITGFRGE